MPQQILIITSDKTTGRIIYDNLSSAGYTVTLTSTLDKPSDREHCPALCVVDLHFKDVYSTGWDDWLLDCHGTQTACIGFNSQAVPEGNLVASLEPLSDILEDTTSFELIKSKAHSLLTIRKLIRQLNATRHQLAHYQESLQDALESAAHIQRSLIPPCQPSYANLQYSCRFMPCKQVGGDLFNIAQLDEQTVMTYVVDVSGHGISSAMVTVSVHQTLSRHTGQLVKKPIEHPPYYSITAPRHVLKELEAEYPFERFEEFFTISYLLINSHTGHIRYSNGGHLPPLLLRSNGEVERLAAGGTVIGVGKLVDFEEGETQMYPGDRLYMYTDGITEHTSKDDEAYGEARFLSQLKMMSARSLDDATRDTLIALREFGGSSLPIDDVTLIGIEYSPAKKS